MNIFWLRLAEGWTGTVAISAEDHYLPGLKRDGTAVITAAAAAPIMDISHWHGVVAVDTSETYCAGVKSDGTLVWAGSYGL